MQEILESYNEWNKAGKAMALVTVIKTWGSAPRPVGSKMIVSEDGVMAGSVSGGCVEGAVFEELQERRVTTLQSFSHDLRNPLAVMRASTSLLQRSSDLADRNVERRDHLIQKIMIRACLRPKRVSKICFHHSPIPQKRRPV